jgi:hypothetical protein
MVFLHGNSKPNPANFGKGQGLARGKRKRKGNARILASKEKKKSNCKIRGVTWIHHQIFFFENSLPHEASSLLKTNHFVF